MFKCSVPIECKKLSLVKMLKFLKKDAFSNKMCGLGCLSYPKLSQQYSNIKFSNLSSLHIFVHG